MNVKQVNEHRNIIICNIIITLKLDSLRQQFVAGERLYNGVNS